MRVIADGQGAMAGHSYKAAVDELDAMVTRDLVRHQLTAVVAVS